MVFRLLEKDCVEEARVIAARHKPAIEPEPSEEVTEQREYLAVDDSLEQRPELIQPHDIMAASAPVHPPVAMVQIFDSNSNTYQYWPLPHVCEIFRSEGRFWDLEQLVLTSRNGLRPEDRRAIYLYTLQSYVDNGLYDRAVTLCKQLEEEGLDQDFPEYFTLMNQFSEAFSCTSWGGSPPSYSSCSTPYPASSEESVPHLSGSDEEAPVPQYKAIKRALLNKNVDEAMGIYRKLEEKGKLLNVTESSALVELLVKHDRVIEAAAITQRMLQRETYPMPKIFRFLLNRLAIQGEAEAMAHFEPYLTSKIKKEVSFDNRLCNAYLSAGKGKEFLFKLQKDLEAANPSNIQAVKDRFPRGGAMGLLENYPHLIDEYSRLAHDFVAHGYIAPMNVLWTYYFINGKHDLAAPLWDKYVKRCPQIMFQKICQTARTQGNLELASKLVSLLHEAKVTSGAQGIAYSCLLDVQSQRGLFEEGLVTLKAGLERGLDLEDINRTALTRLRTGVLSEGKEFDFEIPKKCKAHEERSVSPSSDADY
jgi:leucine-rich PPR motif-containing protein